MNSRRASVIAACLFDAAASLFAAGLFAAGLLATSLFATSLFATSLFATSLFATSPAAAQVQPPQPAAASPWDQQPQTAPWPGQGSQPIQGLPGVQQGPPPPQQGCMQDFGKLRDVAQKRAMAIRTASERKVDAKTACGLFNTFSEAEMKMIKFANANTSRCGIPPEFVKTLTQNHAKTTEIRTRVCQAATAPMPSAAPSLSDALSAPVPDASNIKTGQGTGTYDTLTGTPLGK